MDSVPSDEFSPKTPEQEDQAAFAERDVNKDGWLSGSEIIGINHYDLDGDLEVDLSEFLSGRAAERILLRDGTVVPEDIDLFEGLDSTGSGYISGIDIERGGISSFDVDQNGRVTRKEFYDGRARQRREIAERAAAARAEEAKRRAQTGEPEPAPPLDEELTPKPGFMRGWVLTPGGDPVPEFTIEFVGYNIDAENPRIHGRGTSDPNLIGRVRGRGGYYQIRLPEGSFGFAANIIIPSSEGPKQYPLRTAIDRQTIDYIEVERRNEGVVKNMVWDPESSEIVSGTDESSDAN
jgi:Ca2+-binding EF-hand superfamily protein